MGTTELLFFLGLVVLIGADLACTAVWRHRARRAIDERIDGLDHQLALVTQAVVPIAVAFQGVLVRELTHTFDPQVDRLLAKLGPPSTLTRAEERELFAAMQHRAEDPNSRISASERDAARLLPLIVRRVQAEASHLATAPTMLQLISMGLAVHPSPVWTAPEEPANGD